MNLLPDYGFTYHIDSVDSPVIPRYCWYFNAAEHDFQLNGIRWLEETVGPAIKVRINTLEFFIPSSWYILVIDEESQYIDTVQITQCANSAFKAYLFNPTLNTYEAADVALLDFSQQETCAHVDIPKTMAMCHPVGSVGRAELIHSVMLSPQDLGKYLMGATGKELLL